MYVCLYIFCPFLKWLFRKFPRLKMSSEMTVLFQCIWKGEVLFFFPPFSCLTFSFALSFIFFHFKRSELLRLPEVKWYFSYLAGCKLTRTQDSMDVQRQPMISDGFQPALEVPTHATHEQKGAFISPGDTWICMAVRRRFSPLH